VGEVINIFFANRAASFRNKAMAVISTTRYSLWQLFLNVYYSSNTAFCVLTSIQAFVVIPVRCIEMAKLPCDMMPALGELLQRRQVEWQ
jgi:hypothetical protein